MIKGFVFKNLTRLYKSAPEVEIKNGHRFVIFSDLHIGNSGSRDDFRNNASLFTHILRRFYLAQNYRLILNGDIEELRF